jgi:hypothetical protein
MVAFRIMKLDRDTKETLQLSALVVLVFAPIGLAVLVTAILIESICNFYF